jgi:two-component system chemotaxis response regulator CheB
MTVVRVLVVDDMAVNLHAFTSMLQEDGRMVVVGRASDGHAAMRMVQQLQPDVITLDLEMPKMDGFTFLRLLHATRPTPVVVVSSDSRPHSVFRALEMGAVDFLVKPAAVGRAPLGDLGAVLREKVRAVARLGLRPPLGETLQAPEAPATEYKPSGILCVAIGASTGGPPVVQQILEGFVDPPPFAVVVAQHMPPKFTEAWAERLSRRVRMPVAEMRQAQAVQSGQAYICPGGLITTLKSVGSVVVARISPLRDERFAPSIDTLFVSVANAYGSEATCVVLTGMGNDGAAGARQVLRKKGRVLVEAPMSAVLPTMPQAALDACPGARVMRRDALCNYLSSAATALALVRDKGQGL